MMSEFFKSFGQSVSKPKPEDVTLAASKGISVSFRATVGRGNTGRETPADEYFRQAEEWANKPVELLAEAHAASRFCDELRGVSTISAGIRVFFRGRPFDKSIHSWTD